MSAAQIGTEISAEIAAGQDLRKRFALDTSVSGRAHAAPVEIVIAADVRDHHLAPGIPRRLPGWEHVCI
jgi:hypothetical protein